MFLFPFLYPLSDLWTYSRTPVERPPSPTTIPLIRPYFVWRTVYSVCTIPDQRPSLRRDQRPGQMGFSPSRTTTSPTVYFQESRVAVQHPFPIMYYYNVMPRHLSSNSIEFSDRRCIVTMLPARRRSDTLVVGLIRVLWTSRILGAVISLSACVYLYKFLLYSWQPWLFPPKYISKREKRCCHFFCVVPESFSAQNVQKHEHYKKKLILIVKKTPKIQDNFGSG